MKYVNQYDVPEPMVLLLTRQWYRGYGTPNTVSVTTLSTPPRIVQLSQRYDEQCVKDITDNAWTTFGSAIADALFRAGGIGSWRERRLDVKFKIELERLYEVQQLAAIYNVSGRYDVYDKSLRSLDDYKVTSVWALLDGVKPDWEAQLNCYALMFEKKHQMRVERLRIVPLYRDWSQNKARTSGSFYPAHQSKTIEVTRWLNERTVEYMRDRVSKHALAKFTPQEHLPHCTSDERWVRDEGHAVMKDKNKTATRLYKTDAEAHEAIRVEWSTKWPKSKFRVEYRPGIQTRCANYCDVAPFCMQFADLDRAAYDTRIEQHEILLKLWEKENEQAAREKAA